jgi:hypothetical protein
MWQQCVVQDILARVLKICDVNTSLPNGTHFGTRAADLMVMESLSRVTV